MVRNLQLVCCVIVAVGCNGTTQERDGSEEEPPSVSATLESRLQLAHTLNQQGQSTKALGMIQEVLIESPDDARSLLLAVDIYRSLGKYCEAAEVAKKIAGAEHRLPSEFFVQAFDLCLRCGDFVAAEDILSRAVESEPNQIQGHRLLAQLLNAQGRRFEASEHVRQLIRLRAVRRNEVLSLIDLSGPFLLVSYDPFIDNSKASLFMLGKARHLYVASKSDPDEVLALLQQVTERFPGSAAASAFQGRVLIETGRLRGFPDWINQVPSGIQDQPEYWFAVGAWMANEERHQEAIRAFAEALRRDPTSRESLRSMISSLDMVGSDAKAIELREKLADLDQIFRIAKDANADQALWISTKLQEFTRPWESAAWLMLSAQSGGEMAQRIPELNQRHAAIVAWEQASTAARIQQARAERMLGFEIEQWPLPDLESLDASISIPTLADQRGELRFENAARRLRLMTQFDSGFPTDGGAFFPYQVNGGGVVVFDYDLDGRCDLYFSQSGGKPNDPVGSTPNQLFRLLPGKEFVEVTFSSSTGDRGYGQGVCAGDVNQDGFPDLLVANIGLNVVYINQGDGTFLRSSQLIRDNRESWTSSLGLADLNGDHLPEIVEVNYVDDPQALQTRCEKSEYLLCQPQRFINAPDRVHLCREDGSFALWQPVSNRMRESPKLGFGLVIANFDRRLGNDFFISNDGDFNHYWVSDVASAVTDERFELIESANLRGCSIGRGGNSQACMGVASGDFNRDGTLDLHITNFHNEPVNLFMQTQSGRFSDEALKYRLVEPSFGVLGFGTQAADLNNDGWSDLAVLNGHVYDARDDGIPFRMQPQLFLGSEAGFTQYDNASAGDYWQANHLGRTLAMLDFNRDGRMDLVANHLDAPVAFLQNDSPSENWLQLELIGVSSERDAIGAEVRVETGKEQWTGWQTGGDGYMCTNEPVIHFGLGDTKVVDRVEIRWPSGQSQVFESVQPNTRYLAIEGRQELFRRLPLP